MSARVVEVVLVSLQATLLSPVKPETVTISAALVAPVAAKSVLRLPDVLYSPVNRILPVDTRLVELAVTSVLRLPDVL